MPLEKIVSGGQTGVDRAALDAAVAAGLAIGGWCPRGRRAEDGSIPDRYPLRETPSDAYAQRTAWNVRDSDGTLILVFDDPVGGTALTVDEAIRQGQPHLLYTLTDPAPLGVLRAWLESHDLQVLNVAGPRESEAAGVYEAALAFLQRLFTAG